MASILKVDTITGVSTAGSIAVTGEGNSTTTNLQQGLAKMWINFDGQSTIATRDSHNVSSITDDGTGQYTTSYTSNMASVNYSASGSNNRTGLSSTTFINDTSWTATTGGISSATAESNNNYLDCDAVLISILGDLA
jgi:hypothetical protein